MKKWEIFSKTTSQFSLPQILSESRSRILLKPKFKIQELDLKKELTLLILSLKGGINMQAGFLHRLSQVLPATKLFLFEL